MQDKFCLACGKWLNPHSRHPWLNNIKTVKLPDFCNDKCRKRLERDSKPRNRKKYGVAGEIYSEQRHVQLNRGLK